jgi:hypothetical protein
MAGGRLGALVLLAAFLCGCGSGGGTHSPDLGRLPLTPGAQVIAQVRSCDHGTNAYCAIELVVVDRHYATSQDLVSSEHAQLLHHEWTGATPDTGAEHAAESPGHKLRVTYETAYGDLNAIDLGWVKRSHAIQLALSHTLFKRATGMSMMLELGPG